MENNKTKINLAESLNKKSISPKIKKVCVEIGLKIEDASTWEWRRGYSRKTATIYLVDASRIEELKAALKAAPTDPAAKARAEESAKKRAERKAEDAKIREENSQNPHVNHRYFCVLARNLSNIAEANHNWLGRALSAYAFSFENGGIMAQYMRGGDANEHLEELGFYECLRRAMRAKYRHEETDYDALLRAGCDRDIARDACGA